MSELESQERAKINRFVCKSMIGGGVRCTHENLSISIEADVDSASVFSREDGIDISVDHQAENERPWR